MSFSRSARVAASRWKPAFWAGAAYQDVVIYALFLALLWVRPQGLLGRA